jgi:hypothetical protein
VPSKLGQLEPGRQLELIGFERRGKVRCLVDCVAGRSDSSEVNLVLAVSGALMAMMK